ncbi:MAG: crotonase/enoyl-CoA hydratase family protein [Burkholderiaceae bacterium]|nr:crotonase/enoyl-CoA hydratase family protein [Rhodoferax sp.]MCP5287243.1 crotonase/enoyl-CoA hydratase family protein [Burkholderiaceae bacterium]
MAETESLIQSSRHGDVLHLALNRPAKRNAANDALIAALDAQFSAIPADVRAIVLSGHGEHFCAGLDLSELSERNVFQGILHSRGWHSALDRIQYSPVPVVAVLHGAVVGGGLEIAAACHVRVAENNAFYAFPEGQRGIFVGGGGSVRVPRLIGAARVADMMLTGRVLDAEEAQAMGLSTYLVQPGEGLAKGLALAQKIAANAPMSNYAVIQALPRIAELAPEQGLFVESLVAAIAQGEPAAKERLRAFLEKRAAKVEKPQ